MKKKFALFIFLFLFANTANACFETYPAINHKTKECGYSSSRTVCDGGMRALLKTIPQGDWEIPAKSSDFIKYCNSLGYTFISEEKIVPSKDVCCSLKTNHYIIIVGIILLIVCIIILFRMYKKKK